MDLIPLFPFFSFDFWKLTTQMAKDQTTKSGDRTVVKTKTLVNSIWHWGWICLICRHGGHVSSCIHTHTFEPFRIHHTLIVTMNYYIWIKCSRRKKGLFYYNYYFMRAFFAIVCLCLDVPKRVGMVCYALITCGKHYIYMATKSVHT